MAFPATIAADIAATTLDYYIRGKAFAQTIQDKPLLKVLKANQETFPGGKGEVSIPVQGTYMSGGVTDPLSATFMQGYTEVDPLVFSRAENVKRATMPWKELHAGLVISWTELKKDGITITDDQNVSEHSRVDLIRLTGILQNRLADFGESWARAFNAMMWKDTSNAKEPEGLAYFFRNTVAAAAGTHIIAGIDQFTYKWWQQTNLLTGITSTPEGQELTLALRKQVRLLRKYGGKPDTALAGSGFLEKLEKEYQAKGMYTDQGFTQGKNEMGMNEITMKGLGTFKYDPTLDDSVANGGMNDPLGCYIFDSSKVKQYVMEGEENKTLNPTRPHDILVFLRSMTWTGCLLVHQMNCNAHIVVA